TTGVPGGPGAPGTIPYQVTGNAIDSPEPLNGTYTAIPYGAQMITSAVDWSGSGAPSTAPQDSYNNPIFLAGNNLDTLHGFRALHPGGANFCFADGSVHFINTTISQLIYEQLSTMQGGEIVAMFAGVGGG